MVLEVQELVAFETRWLTDALVNRDAKGLYEVLPRCSAPGCTVLLVSRVLFASRASVCLKRYP